MKTVVLVIVNYRTSQLTVKLCKSVARCKSIEGLRIVIVDNASDAESLRALKDGIPAELSVEILTEKNLGYFGAARRALMYVKAQGLDPNWFILSNSDIEIHDTEFFEKLWEQAADVGILAPAVTVSGANLDQNPFMRSRPSSKRMRAYKWIYRLALTGMAYELLALAKAYFRRRRPQSLRQRKLIYAAHGSFMIFSSHYIKGSNAFEHEPFLFGEEITAAEFARKKALSVFYEPSLRVEHVVHASLGALPSRRKLSWLRHATQFCADHYFARHD